MEQSSPNRIELINVELEQKIAFAKEHAIISELLTKNPFSEEDMEAVRNARIHCATLYELRKTLAFLKIKPEEVMDTLAHENAHANKAESINANHEGYYVLVGKVNGGYTYRVSTDIDFPKEWDFNKKKESA